MVSTGVPLVTVKPLVSVTTSALVVSVTLRAVAAAAGSMLITTVALVGEFTVTDTTLTPVPLNMAVVVFCTQCVNMPVMVNDSFCWPCWPVLGFTCVIAGVPLITVKPLFSVTTSALVVMVTLRAVAAAAGSMLITTVALVGEFTVTDTTFTPVPLNMAVVVFCTQCVNMPVIVRDSFCWPCRPVLGFTCVITGVALVTVKPLFNVTTSALVVMVTLRAVVAAAGSMLITTVALVGEFTVTDTTLTPVPLNAAVVVFCTQCVNIPVIVNDSFCWPCWPVLGFTWVITGVPLVTVKPLVSVTTSALVVSVTSRAVAAAAGSMLIPTV